MPVFIDQTGRKVSLQAIPQRIISLVPSQTELLADLGLAEEVIGITKFCIHPTEWFRNKKRVGGTKVIDFNAIHQLQPDLVIANKEENVKEQIEELEKLFPVWVSDVNDLPGAYTMIDQVGLLTNKQEKAKEINQKINAGFAQLQNKLLNSKKRVIYLIWQKPYMTIGGDTFIHAMLEAAGFTNLFAQQKRYPEISLEDMKAANPDLILLSSEPFSFNKKHADQLLQFIPSAKVVMVDGEMFSWYGSRLLQAPEYFAGLQLQIK